MKLHTALDKASVSLQSAVDQRDFTAIMECAVRYGDLVRRALAELPREEAVVAVQAASRNLANARRVIFIARSRLANRLRRLTRVTGYRAPAALHTWSMEG